MNRKPAMTAFTSTASRLAAACCLSWTVLVSPAALAQSAGGPGQDQARQGAGAGSQQREPPAQAYEDCKGKKAGDAVQHTTPEGKVTAICADSPKGLVARPGRSGDAAVKGGAGGR